MIPVTHEEFFLAYLEGEEVEIPAPVTRKEMYLAYLCGEEIELPIPVTIDEMYLAALCEMISEVPYPVTRMQIIWAQLLKDDESDMIPATREEWYWTHIHLWEFNTASGNPVTFTTLRSAPLKSLEIAFSPKQDLHGYDNPWPAGGGKNKYDKSSAVDNANYFGQDGTITHISGVYVCPSIPLANGTYTISFTPAGSSDYVRLNILDSNGEFIRREATLTTSPITFTMSGSDAMVQLAVNGPLLDTLQLESGSTASSYVPYENICPVSGWDSLHVYDDPLYAGVIEWNQLFGLNSSEWASVSSNVSFTTLDDGFTLTSAINSSTAKGIFNNTVSEHIYCMLCEAKISDAENSVILGRYSSSGTRLTYASTSSTDFASLRVITKATSNDQRLYIRMSNASPTGTVATIRNPMCLDLTQMFGTEVADYILSLETAKEGDGVAYVKSLFPHDYYPYNTGTETLVGTVNGMGTRTISITIGQTVYGGTVDVLTGVVTVDRKIRVLNGNAWTPLSSGTHRYYTQTASDADTTWDTVISNVFKTTRIYSETTDSGIGMVLASGQQHRIAVRPPADSGVTNATEMKAYIDGLAETLGTDIVACYKLVTPIVYDLTPQEVSSLLGENNMWSDANGDLTIEYRSN